MSTTTDWLHELSGLTDTGSGRCITGLDVARGHAAALLQAAAAVRRLHATDCAPGHHCDLGVPDQAACTLAGHLAPAASDVSDEGAVPRYLDLLRTAAPAVATCRRVAHPAGECWFSPDGIQRCGEVLTAAHRLRT